MGSVIHFDISADDVQRAGEFYEKLFGWKVEKYHEGPEEYFMIDTRSRDGQKGIGGGIARRENPGQGITNFIDVESIDNTLEKVEKLGGKVISPKMTIPNIGYIATCLDTEGNVFGIMEVDEKAK